MWRHLSAWVVVALVAVSAGSLVLAWNQPFHKQFSLLSPETLGRPEPVSAAGRSGRGLLTYLTAGELEAGSVESDDERNARPWINQSHKTDNARIFNSSQAALNEYAVLENPVPMASRRLGRAFHYLQDQTELSEDARKAVQRVTGKDSRTFAERRMDRVKQPGTEERQSFERALRAREMEYRQLTWSGIQAQVPLIAAEFEKLVAEALKAPASPLGLAEGREAALGEAYGAYFAAVVALQNQIIRFYHVRADEAMKKRADTFLGVWSMYSNWPGRPQFNTPWTLTLHKEGGKMIASSSNGNFPCTAATDGSLEFTDDSGKVHRRVTIKIWRKEDGSVTGSFTGRGRENDEFSGTYTIRRKAWPEATRLDGR